MNIDHMEAGPDMDALVAEAVMGWRIGSKRIVRPDGSGFDAPFEGDWHDRLYGRYSLPPYSTDIAAAWLVVENLQSKGVRTAINSTCDAGLYDVTVGNAVRDFYCQVFVPAPLGICRAALKFTIVCASSESERS